jgi:hypothetical protein
MTESTQIRLALAVTVTILAAVQLLQVGTREARWYDFGHFYATAMMLRGDATAHLYDQNLQTEYQERTLHRPGVLPFISPPFVALAFVPLTFLPYAQAYLIFGLMSIVVWVWFALRTRRFSGLLPFRHLAVCFTALPLWRALNLGQLAFIALALLTLCYVSLREAREFKAGIWAGLLLFRFQLVLPLLIVWLVRKRWRSLAGMVLPAVGYLAVSFAMLGWTGIINYIRMLSMINKRMVTDSSAWQMPTLRAFFSTVLSPSLATVATIICTSGLLILIIMRWRSIPAEQSFAALLIAAVISAGYAHVYDLSAVSLALLLCPGAAASRFGIAVAIYMWCAFLIAESVPAASLLWPCLSVPLGTYAAALLLRRIPKPGCVGNAQPTVVGMTEG